MRALASSSVIPSEKYSSSELPLWLTNGSTATESTARDFLIGGVRSTRRVVDVAGKTPVEDLVSLAPEPSQVVTIANFDAGRAGARVTGGGADSHPMEALALVAKLLAQNKLVIKVQTFPFERASEAYRISQGGHVRGKLVLVP